MSIYQCFYVDVPFCRSVYQLICLSAWKSVYSLQPNLQYGLGPFLVVHFGLLHYRDEGQFLQLLQDGGSCTLLRQLLAVALTLSRELAHRHTGQEALHVGRPTLLQHLGTEEDRKVCETQSRAGYDCNGHIKHLEHQLPRMQLDILLTKSCVSTFRFDSTVSSWAAKQVSSVLRRRIRLHTQTWLSLVQ